MSAYSKIKKKFFSIKHMPISNEELINKARKLVQIKIYFISNNIFATTVKLLLWRNIYIYMYIINLWMSI